MLEQNFKKKKTKAIVVAAITAFVCGVVISMLLMVAVMPSMMLITAESKADFDSTVEAIQQRIEENGWVVSSVLDMNKSLSRHSVEFVPRVKLIKLCHPQYAKSVLESDRYISAMMPCTFSVWEDDEGKVFVTKMNMKLMAKMFGGNIAKVMGGDVARDEEAILEGLLKD